MSSNKRLKLFGTKLNDGSTARLPNTGKEHLLIRFYDPATNAKDHRGRKLDDILAWDDRYFEQSHDYIQMLFPLPEGSMFNSQAPPISREVMDAFRSRPSLQARLRQSFARILDFYGFALKEGSEGEDDETKQAKSEEIEKIEAGEELTSDTGGAEDVGVDEQTKATSEEQGKKKVTQDQPMAEATASEAEEHPTTTPNDTGIKPATATIPMPKECKDIRVIRAPHFPRASRNWAVRFDHNHLRITRIIRCLRVLGLEPYAQAFWLALQEVGAEPTNKISERSFIFWQRAAKRSLWKSPDGDSIMWLKAWEEEQNRLAEEITVRSEKGMPKAEEEGVADGKSGGGAEDAGARKLSAAAAEEEVAEKTRAKGPSSMLEL